MSVIVKTKYLRIAPRKVRLVADLIRGKTVKQAEAILAVTIKKGVAPLTKLLKSGIAAAKEKDQTESTNLCIAKITVDGGPMLKRWRARARGRAAMIQKRSSHITLVLSERAKSKIQDSNDKSNPKSKTQKN